MVKLMIKCRLSLLNMDGFFYLKFEGGGSHPYSMEKPTLKDPFSLTVMHRGRFVVSRTQKVAIRVSSFSGGEICFHLNSLFML